MDLLYKYRNGNYNVLIFDDGTKVRQTNESVWKPDFAENIDIKLTNKCTGTNCAYCLIPSAKLNTKESTKEISAIKPGDEVLSMNINNNELQFKPVIKLYKHKYSGNLISIKLDNNITLYCTPNHKIYTKNRGYVGADKLDKDDVLIIN